MARHVDAPLQIQDGAVDSVARLDDNHSRSRRFGGIIRGPKQTRLFGQIFVDFALIPDVVAAGDHVDAVPEDLVGELRRDPESGRSVLAVGDGQMDILGDYDFGQMPGHHAAAHGSKNIADK